MPYLAERRGRAATLPIASHLLPRTIPPEPMTPPPASIERHKTAIRRPSFSLPVKCLLRDGLLDASKSLFDYGCGHGQDLALLRDLGISCDGWDPVHRPGTPAQPAQVVNVGYVINIIEDPRERAEAVRRAWELAG